MFGARERPRPTNLTVSFLELTLQLCVVGTELLNAPRSWLHQRRGPRLRYLHLTFLLLGLDNLPLNHGIIVFYCPVHGG